MSADAPILVVTEPLPSSELAKLIGSPFPDMVKFVVDVDRGIAAVGGHLHADGEALLLGHGCHQGALWGGNYYPDLDEEECVQYESLINIRPGAGNASLEVEDLELRGRIRAVVLALIGRGRARP